MSENMVVAVPMESGEGLSAVCSPHFGHAAGFVLISVDGESVSAVRTITNPPHAEGGCMAIVRLLVENGVTNVSAAGMGGGPLAGLTSAGVTVHHDAGSATVRQAVEAVITGSAAPFGDDHTCRGH